MDYARYYDQKNARVLIVDDEDANVRLLKGILGRAGYTDLVATTDSREVVPLFTEAQPDLILLDLMMPYLDGFEVMEQLVPLIPWGTYLPILVLTANITAKAKKQALEMGAKDFVIKPFDNTEVLLRIKNLLETRFLNLQLQTQNQILDEKVRERTQELEQSRFEILDRLTLVGEYRDDDTGQHNHRVGHVSAVLAQGLGLPEDEVELIRRLAPLHDLGKVGIPDSILLKPSRLTAYEFEVMKMHTIIGARILSEGHSKILKIAQTIALTHHERWDGTGYPHNQKGELIPQVGRIVALADVFDALTHYRPYKEAWPFDQAVAEIVRQSGKQFDPRLVDVFTQMDAQTLTLTTERLPKPTKRDPMELGDFQHQVLWRSVTEPLSNPERFDTQFLSSE